MTDKDESESPPREVTLLLRAWSDGDEAAREALFPLVYGELKTLARSLRRRHGVLGARGPETATLVQEAAVRLLGAELDAQDRHHFFALAAQAMRYVMVDAARRRLAKKRAAEEVAATEGLEQVASAEPRAEEILAVHQALSKLQLEQPRSVQVVELRYFAGLTIEETAEALAVSTPTAKRDWAAARRWLHAALQP
jgi:RNA polymerase sigma-70 factor, ECF subfamily